MVADRNEDLDVIGIAQDDLEAAVQVFFVRRGRVVGRKGFIVDKVEDLTPGGLVARILEELYGDEPTLGVPKQVLVPAEPESMAVYEEWLTQMRGPRVQVRVPQRGDKRELHEAVTRRTGSPPPAPRPQQPGQGDQRVQDLLGLPPNGHTRIRCYDMATSRGRTTSARWW
jgi:excinuclease ABC subunit C